MAKKRTLKINHALFGRAKRLLVGGVNSPVRSFAYVEAEPVLIEKGKGSRVYDYDGNAYIDYILSWGALILGHGHKGVVKELRQSAKSGFSFGATHKSEIELAALIQRKVPFIEKIRFTTSGTEAVMGAVRLSRGYTRRAKIIKFEHAYHGHADYLLTKAGSGLASLSIPASAGVPENFVKDTLVLPFGDKDAARKVFSEYGKEIAAVLVEPAGANYGVHPPDINFLKELRALTAEYGALLIFDEVITAYRFSLGSLALQIDIIPDLICLGKIIGGGLPIGAYGGPKRIMEKLAPLGDVYQAATFSGNPLVMAAGKASLEALEGLKNKYASLAELTVYLASRIKEEADSRGIGLGVSYCGTMFSLRFERKKDFAMFHRAMLDRGVYLAPSEFEANFLSFAHSKGDIEKTILAAKEAFREGMRPGEQAKACYRQKRPFGRCPGTALESRRKPASGRRI